MAEALDLNHSTESLKLPQSISSWSWCWSELRIAESPPLQYRTGVWRCDWSSPPDPNPSIMSMIPESEIQAKFFADTSEKRSENVANIFADFRPSIARKSGRKKFHEKSSTSSTRGRNKILSRRYSGSGRGQPVLDKISGPMGSPCSSSTGLWGWHPARSLPIPALDKRNRLPERRACYSE